MSTQTTLERITIEDVIDKDHLKWAKECRCPAMRVYKALLAKDHWILTPETKEIITKEISLTEQMASWRREYSTRLDLLGNDSEDDVPLTPQEFLVSLEAFDATYDYSDDINAWRHGNEQHKRLKECLKNHPEWYGLLSEKPKWLLMSDFPRKIDLSPILFDIKNNPEWKVPISNIRSPEALLFATDTKEEFQQLLTAMDTFRKVRDSVRNWRNINGVPLYTKYAPKKTLTLACPSWMPDALTEAMDLICGVGANKAALMLLINRAKENPQYCSELSAQVIKADNKTALLLVRFGYSKFYHEVRGIDLRNELWRK